MKKIPHLTEKLKLKQCNGQQKPNKTNLVINLQAVARTQQAGRFYDGGGSKYKSTFDL